MSTEIDLKVTGTMKQIAEAGNTLIKAVRETWPNAVRQTMGQSMAIVKDEEALHKWDTSDCKASELAHTAVIMTPMKKSETEYGMLVVLGNTEDADVKHFIEVVRGLGLPVEEKVFTEAEVAKMDEDAAKLAKQLAPVLDLIKGLSALKKDSGSTTGVTQFAGPTAKA